MAKFGFDESVLEGLKESGLAVGGVLGNMATSVSDQIDAGLRGDEEAAAGLGLTFGSFGGSGNGLSSGVRLPSRGGRRLTTNELAAKEKQFKEFDKLTPDQKEVKLGRNKIEDPSTLPMDELPKNVEMMEQFKIDNPTNTVAQPPVRPVAPINKSLIDDGFSGAPERLAARMSAKTAFNEQTKQTAQQVMQAQREMSGWQNAVKDATQGIKTAQSPQAVDAWKMRMAVAEDNLRVSQVKLAARQEQMQRLIEGGDKPFRGTVLKSGDKKTSAAVVATQFDTPSTITASELTLPKTLTAIDIRAENQMKAFGISREEAEFNIKNGFIGEADIQTGRNLGIDPTQQGKTPPSMLEGVIDFINSRKK